jgi:hypothetical protein
MEKKYLKVVIGMVVLFALGLVLFYMFSAGLGDGLEKTMENNGVQEQPPVYNAPLSYGEDYMTTLLMGLIGFGATFAVIYGLLRVAKKRKLAEHNADRE